MVLFLCCADAINAMIKSPRFMSASVSSEGEGRCPSCKQVYPQVAAHACAATAETLAGSGDAAQLLPVPTGTHDDLLGTILGDRYEIKSRLGQGGMGAVYKVRHTVLERALAVKILLRPQDEEAQRRFLIEAKLASKLDHPNTVHVSDFGVLPDGRTYLVMEYLSGPTLSRALTKGRFTSPRSLSIAAQIARGLSAVHGAGIVHRAFECRSLR